MPRESFESRVEVGARQFKEKIYNKQRQSKEKARKSKHNILGGQKWLG